MRATQARLSTAAIVLLLGLAAGCTPSTPQPSPSDGSTSQDADTPDAAPSSTDPSPDPGSPADSDDDPIEPSPSGTGGEPPSAVPTSAPSPPGDTATPDPPRPEPDAGEKAPVVPNIVYAGVGSDLRIVVNGFVPGIIEEGGTCTASVEGTGIAASSPAVPDASTTWCEEIVMDRPEGNPSDWRIVLRYTSPTHQGSSTPTPVSAS